MGQGSAPEKPAKRSRKTPGGSKPKKVYHFDCDVCQLPSTASREDARTCNRNNGRCRKKKSAAMKKARETA